MGMKTHVVYNLGRDCCGRCCRCWGHEGEHGWFHGSFTRSATCFWCIRDRVEAMRAESYHTFCTTCWGNESSFWREILYVSRLRICSKFWRTESYMLIKCDDRPVRLWSAFWFMAQLAVAKQLWLLQSPWKVNSLSLNWYLRKPWLGWVKPPKLLKSIRFDISCNFMSFSSGPLKSVTISQVFNDSYKSPLSVIVVDNIERLIGKQTCWLL